MSVTFFATQARLEAAAGVFRSRGYVEVTNPLEPLWPGDFRRSKGQEMYRLEWAPFAESGAEDAPLWDLLRMLHSERSRRWDADRLIGFAVVLLEAGKRPRGVWKRVLREGGLWR